MGLYAEGALGPPAQETIQRRRRAGRERRGLLPPAAADRPEESPVAAVRTVPEAERRHPGGGSAGVRGLDPGLRLHDGQHLTGHRENHLQEAARPAEGPADRITGGCPPGGPARRPRGGRLAVLTGREPYKQNCTV